MKVKTFIFNPFQENTYVLSDTNNKCIIIDAGCLDMNEKNDLYNYIKGNELTVERIINTHLHLDHCFGNQFVAETFNKQIEAHPDDEPLLSGMNNYSHTFGIDYTENHPKISYLYENDIITVGEIVLKAIHVPGHSKGSLVFYAEKEKFLFAGDVLFSGSIGRTDLPGGNFHDLIDNIKLKLLVLPDETVVFSGHGAQTTILHEKQHNPFL
jgi:hydroxyacylglutathione hydrolase